MTGDHYLPAALIGGFGVPSGRKSGRRYAKVAVRFRSEPETVELKKAEDICKEIAGYRLLSPPTGISPEIIDRLWRRSYETNLPEAISAIEGNRYTAAHWATIGLHMAAQGTRHPEFLNHARRFLADQGALVQDPDLLQLQRIKTFKDGMALLAQSRIALVGRASGSRRFVINDKGYVNLQGNEFGQHGIFFPLSGSLMVLAVLGSRESEGWDNARPERHLTLTLAGVEFLNEVAWRLSGIGCVIGHPDDSHWISRLDFARPLMVPKLGPYRDARGDFFDWAR